MAGMATVTFRVLSPGRDSWKHAALWLSVRDIMRRHTTAARGTNEQCFSRGEEDNFMSAQPANRAEETSLNSSGTSVVGAAVAGAVGESF